MVVPALAEIVDPRVVVRPVVGILVVHHEVVLMVGKRPMDKHPVEVVGSIHLEEELGILGLLAAVDSRMGCLEEAS